jgi:hypothetical protein
MLLNLSEQVADCYRRAAECKELAEIAQNPKDRAFYLEREQGWLSLAQSYQVSENIGRVVDERARRVVKGYVCPDCSVSTVARYSTLFVCTNCQRVMP